VRDRRATWSARNTRRRTTGRGSPSRSRPGRRRSRSTCSPTPSRYGSVLAENAPVLVQGNIIRGADGPRVNVKECYPLDLAVSRTRAPGHVAHQARAPGPRALPAALRETIVREAGDTRMEFAVLLEGAWPRSRRRAPRSRGASTAPGLPGAALPPLVAGVRIETRPLELKPEPDGRDAREPRGPRPGSVRPGVPADAALREYLAGNRTLGAVGRRSVSRAVFTYFRWLNWLGPDSDSSQKRVLRRSTTRPASTGIPRASSLRPSRRGRSRPGSPARWSFPAGTCAGSSRSPRSGSGPRRARPRGRPEPRLSAEPVSLPAPLSRPRRPLGAQVQGDRGPPQGPGLPVGRLRDPGPRLAAGRPRLRAGAGRDLVGRLRRRGREGAPPLRPHANKGLLWATDRSLRRLSILKKRAARAGMFNYRTPCGRGREPRRSRRSATASSSTRRAAASAPGSETPMRAGRPRS
jgi:hypothetical protein